MTGEAAWVHLEAGRLLAVRSHGRDRFHLPGGGPEPGEAAEQTLLREICEEPASLRTPPPSPSS
ncbi:NUDIX domain-containing protein [Streptomyces olivoreticuli]|uniref:NUDIX domain-containing protein n=1 Tax=Streptomyces olivoreticuli TaxID=68246 RepID=UPI001F0732A1|nr:NUDIX domain-containing protein [Streptomyces olivoreticuli]